MSLEIHDFSPFHILTLTTPTSECDWATVSSRRAAKWEGTQSEKWQTHTHTHRWCITALPLVDIQKNNCLSWSEPIVVVKLLCLCQIPVSDVCVSTLSETEPNVSTALVKVLSVVPDSCRETNKDVTKRQKVSQRCIDKGEGSNNNAPYRAFWTSTGEENSSIIKNRNYYKAANIRRDIIKKGLLCVQSYGCFFTLWWEVRVN